jgi:hypothetical protein
VYFAWQSEIKWFELRKWWDSRELGSGTECTCIGGLSIVKCVDGVFQECIGLERETEEN